jgi:hypothetical protein
MTTLDEAIAQLQLKEVFAVGEYEYEWAEFRAWVAPSGRYYYWFADSGCSCRGYGEETFYSAANFSDGARSTLERAFRAWRQDNCNRPVEGVDEAMEKLRRLRA